MQKHVNLVDLVKSFPTNMKIWRRYRRERTLYSLLIWLKNPRKVRYRTGINEGRGRVRARALRLLAPQRAALRRPLPDPALPGDGPAAEASICSRLRLSLLTPS